MNKYLSLNSERSAETIMTIISKMLKNCYVHYFNAHWIDTKMLFILLAILDLCYSEMFIIHVNYFTWTNVIAQNDLLYPCFHFRCTDSINCFICQFSTKSHTISKSTQKYLKENTIVKFVQSKWDTVQPLTYINIHLLFQPQRMELVQKQLVFNVILHQFWHFFSLLLYYHCNRSRHI